MFFVVVYYIWFSHRRSARATASYGELNLLPSIAEEVETAIAQELSSLRRRIDSTLDSLNARLAELHELGMGLESQRNIFVAKALDSLINSGIEMDIPAYVIFAIFLCFYASKNFVIRFSYSLCFTSNI